MKKYITLLLITMSILYCGATQNPTDVEKAEGKKPPVDEGFENTPKEDKVKGIVFATDKKVITLKIYLSKEKDSISIKFKEVSRVPFICKIMRKDKIVWSSEPKKPKNPRDRTLEFKIDKSKLSVGDVIKIFNRRDIVVGWIEVVK